MIREFLKSVLKGFSYTLGKLILWGLVGLLLYYLFKNSDLRWVVYPI